MIKRNDSGDLKSSENLFTFFEDSLCGFIIADGQGNIQQVNTKITTWTGQSKEALKGKRFSDLLTIGSKIYYETHLWPLLRMQGFFDEIVIELSGVSGKKWRVMINARENKDVTGNIEGIHFTILKASDRLQYEQNLQQMKAAAEQETATQQKMVALREQLIAVLGHDLRNPLSAIVMAADLLDTSPGTDNTLILATLKRSSSRMTELVSNMMDFARTRLGEGIVLKRQDVMLEPILQQVVAEFRLIYPRREITITSKITTPVNCDSDRLAQLLSNLLANALTHGDANFPVRVNAIYENKNLELSVTNNGVPIPADLHERLFAPFTREAGRVSQNGLGLGLYICAEIAKAHNGTLSFTSSIDETVFTLRIDA